jgi:hypothetical protein
MTKPNFSERKGSTWLRTGAKLIKRFFFVVADDQDGATTLGITTLRIMTFITTTLSINSIFAILVLNDTQHYNTPLC